jgi:hypothetical protein
MSKDQIKSQIKDLFKDQFMRRSILMLTLLATALWSAPGFAQSRKQLGSLCTTDTTPADQQIDACNKILALKCSPARISRRFISGARSAGTRRATTPR